MKMKVLLLVLFLCFSGLNFGAQATEQVDSSLIMESKFPESLETELDSVNDDKGDDKSLLSNEKRLSKRGNWTNNPTTSSPRSCNGHCSSRGTKVCRPDRRPSCLCRRGYTGDRCQFDLRFCNINCFNGGTKICGRIDRNPYCICRRGYTGNHCQTWIFGPTTSVFPRFTTRRPGFITPKWFLGYRYRRCYKCRIASSPRHCVLQTICESGECFSGRASMLNHGRRFYFAGCLKRFDHPDDCQRTCIEAKRRGLVSECSIRCCHRDLCNREQLPTSRPFTRPWFTTRRPRFRLMTRRPWFTRRPTARHRIILRIVWRLLRALKSIIDALTILLKSHMNGGRARGYKREITSLMDKVDFHEQQLEDSRDPEVLRVKQDVSATRMRAQAIIKKLDEFIGEDSNDDNNK